MAASPTAAASAAQPQTSTDSFVLSDMSVQSLARMWRMLDEDTDGLLQPDQLRTMIAAVGIPPTQQLVAGITQCAPEKWRDKGVDIDTVSWVAPRQFRIAHICNTSRRSSCLAVRYI